MGGTLPTQGMCENSSKPASRPSAQMEFPQSWKPSAETIPTAGITTQKSRGQIVIRIKALLCAIPIRVFCGVPWLQGECQNCYPERAMDRLCKENIGYVRLQPGVTFCLHPALNSHLGFQRCISYAGMEKAWRT